MMYLAKSTLGAALVALTTVASPLAADSIPQTDVVEEFNIVPTDAIRIEVDASSPMDCALQVMQAFDLPEGTLMFHPICELVEGPAVLTSASN